MPADKPMTDTPANSLETHALSDQSPASNVEQPELPGSGGAPKGNRNALRHGLRCSTMPDGSRDIEGDLSRFRKEIEDRVLAERGSVSVEDSDVINSAVRAERRARLADRHLMRGWESMTNVERLRFMEIEERNTAIRRREVERLRLKTARAGMSAFGSTALSELLLRTCMNEADTQKATAALFGDADAQHPPQHPGRVVVYDPKTGREISA